MNNFSLISHPFFFEVILNDRSSLMTAVIFVCGVVFFLPAFWMILPLFFFLGCWWLFWGRMKWILNVLDNGQKVMANVTEFSKWPYRGAYYLKYEYEVNHQKYTGFIPILSFSAYRSKVEKAATVPIKYDRERPKKSYLDLQALK